MSYINIINNDLYISNEYIIDIRDIVLIVNSSDKVINELISSKKVIPIPKDVKKIRSYIYTNDNTLLAVSGKPKTIYDKINGALKENNLFGERL